MEKQLKKTAGITNPGLKKSELMDEYAKWQKSCLPYDQVQQLRGYTGPNVTAEALTDFVPEGRRTQYKILDIGAGTGLVASELHGKGFVNIDALEPSDHMLRDAKGKQLYRNIFKQFLTKEPLPIDNDHYDAVVSCGSFMENHIPVEAIKELIRIVKPDGIIVITTRHKYLDSVSAYKDKLEPFMKEQELAGRWRRLERRVFPKYYQEDQGIVWKYIVEDKRRREH